MGAVDLLASEYSWSKHDILNDTSLFELLSLSQKIKNRKNSDFRMQLAIAQNPHVENPEKLWEQLEIDDDYDSPEVEEFDKVGFEILKRKLGQNPRFKIK